MDFKEINLNLLLKLWNRSQLNVSLKIEDDYRKSRNNQKQRYFYPLNEETNFKLINFLELLQKIKNIL